MEEQDFSFVGYDNTKIYSVKNIVSKPKANIVIVHGVFEHLSRYDYLTEKLNNNGYNVYRYDARGHGRSEGERGDLKEYNHYLLDLDILIDLVRKENNLKIILLGHSMGGLVATSYASISDKIDYLVLSGACNVTPKVARLLRFIPDFFTKFITYKNDLGSGVCGDSKVVEEYNKDPLVIKKGKIRLMKNAFIRGCDLVKNNIDKINVPTLIMHGKEDGIVISSTGEWTYNNLKVEDKKLIIYDDLYHEIFNEIKKDYVIEDMLNWINSKMEEK